MLHIEICNLRMALLLQAMKLVNAAFEPWLRKTRCCREQPQLRKRVLLILVWVSSGVRPVTSLPTSKLFILEAFDMRASV